MTPLQRHVRDSRRALLRVGIVAALAVVVAFYAGVRVGFEAGLSMLFYLR